MIEVKIEKKGKEGLVVQDLYASGSTKDLLLELTMLTRGILASLKIPHKITGEKMPMNKRIEMFCNILKASEED